jgi:hypothetical protein
MSYTINRLMAKSDELYTSQILENFQNQDGGRAFFRKGLVAKFLSVFQKKYATF